MLRISTGRYRRIFAQLIIVEAVVLGAVRTTAARDLTDVFVQGFSIGTVVFDETGTFARSQSLAGAAAAAAAVAPAIASAVAQAVTQEFPLASVSPAFTYRYNPALSAFERRTGVPGPLFAERAPALGRGQFNTSVGYSFIDFSDINGEDLDDLRSPGFLAETFSAEFVDPALLPPRVTLVNGAVGFPVPISFSQLRTRIDLNAHVIVPALRYGITDNWDISLAIPIVNTFLRIKNEAVRVADIGLFFAADARGQPGLTLLDPSGNPVNLATLTRLPFIKSRRSAARLSKAAGSATGVGDISLRSKYHFWRTPSGGAALGLNLLLPSGEVEKFHGADETHLSTFIYLSEVLMERFEPHLNVGVDFNADDVDRSSFLYAVGASVLLWKQLGLVIDFVGRSEFGKFQIRVPRDQEGNPLDRVQGLGLDRAPTSCTLTQPCFQRPGATSFSIFPVNFQRNDIADFSFGLRQALGTSGSIFFGGVIPLNDDGLRADFIPSGGIEYTF